MKSYNEYVSEIPYEESALGKMEQHREETANRQIEELKRIADAAQEQSRHAKAKARKADIKGIVALLISVLSFLLQIIIHHTEIVDFIKKLAGG